MADITSPSASAIPQKRSFTPSEDSSIPRTKPPREKKDTWRKKEALQSGTGSVGTSGKQPEASTPKSGPGNKHGELPGLVRYRLPPPRFQDYYGHRAPPMVHAELEAPKDGAYYSVTDHPMNRRSFRYSPCEASMLLPSLAYRGTEYEPFKARINFEDMNGQLYVSKDGSDVTNTKGWRMARANIGVREGDWYFEVKILNGISEDGTSNGHVRLGWARREAPLDAPVGFDAYSYGLRDQNCQKVHMSRPKDFSPEQTFVTGDVIGLQISLPSLSLQRNISGDPTVKAGDIIRDRIPIRFKNQLWFEHFEYHPTKDFEELMNPSSGTRNIPQPKTLPGSYIRVYRNGSYIGTPFEDLYAFLPPASKPQTSGGGRELDDGSLGYYPAVSTFKGGAVHLNFGPDWLCRPDDLGSEVRGMWERYNEQIAEDVTYDLVDEVDLLFTAGGLITDDDNSKGMAAGAGRGGKEEIKEMVMEDE